MTKQAQPVKTPVEAGKDYYWCSCGASKGQPLCDGSHKTTGKTPQRFSVDQDSDVFLCTCKQTENPPYCDGSHKSL